MGNQLTTHLSSADVLNVGVARREFRTGRRAPVDVRSVTRGIEAAPLDRRLVVVGDLQQSLATTPQLGELGLDRSAIHRRAAAGQLNRIHRSVYSIGRRSLGPLGQLLAAVLATDPSLLAGRSALALWGALPIDASAPHVLAPARRRIPGINVHITGSLAADDCCALDYIPLTAPARSLLDFAADADPAELETALNELRIARLIKPHDLDELRARTFGHQGWKWLGRLLDAEREPGFSRKEAERRLLRLIREAALNEPRLNVRIGRWEVDFFWPAHRLVVEVDGYGVHGQRRAFERDRRKQAELQERGLEVLRFSWLQITEQPLWVIARLASRLQARRP